MCLEYQLDWSKTKYFLLVAKLFNSSDFFISLYFKCVNINTTLSFIFLFSSENKWKPGFVNKSNTNIGSCNSAKMPLVKDSWKSVCVQLASLWSDQLDQ